MCYTSLVFFFICEYCSNFAADKANVMRPLILISNDDGYTSRGLAALIDAMRPLGDIFVVAPDGPRSGASCSITDAVPISYKHVHSEEGLKIYSCSGSPVMCTKLALDQLLMRQPDLIVAGINHGSNASINVHYSGTTAVTTEAALHGIPSVAFSLNNHDLQARLEHLVPICTHIAGLVLEHGLPYGSYLNVNIPETEEIQGIRVCRMAYSRWVEEFEPCPRSRGGHYFWLSGEQVDDEPSDDSTDLWAMSHDYVAITPIMIDPTDYELIRALKEWDL